MDLGLEGKVAVVTGGSMGIGSAVAEGLAKERVNVAILARGGPGAIARAAELSGQYGVRAAGIPADVTKAEDIDRAVSVVMRDFGGVDILINNAGTGSNETILQADDSKWQYYWDLHVMAAVRMSRALAPSMQSRGGGVILNTASICARQPCGYEPIYNVTKAALAMFSKCLANELIGSGVRVNVVNPGLILTPDWENTAKEMTRNTGMSWQEYLDKVAQETAPIQRFATPEELAHFYVFLCSTRASYCTGSTYYVDGGALKVVV